MCFLKLSLGVGYGQSQCCLRCKKIILYQEDKFFKVNECWFVWWWWWLASAAVLVALSLYAKDPPLPMASLQLSRAENSTGIKA